MKIITKIIKALKKDHTPSFEDSMGVLSTALTQLSPPKSPLRENWMVFDSESNLACIIDPHGNTEHIELPKESNA